MLGDLPKEVAFRMWGAKGSHPPLCARTLVYRMNWSSHDACPVDFYSEQCRKEVFSGHQGFVPGARLRMTNICMNVHGSNNQNDSKDY